MLDKKGFHVPTCAVVSAAAGVTDELIAVVQVCVDFYIYVCVCAVVFAAAGVTDELIAVVQVRVDFISVCMCV